MAVGHAKDPTLQSLESSIDIVVGFYFLISAVNMEFFRVEFVFSLFSSRDLYLFFAL
ncbi:hypothetical protein BJX65DRAFT_281690 [Aspergillus insuetus]